MLPYKYQLVAKARIRKHDVIAFKETPAGPEICGVVMNVSCTRTSTGAYTEIFVGDNVDKVGKWYKTESMIVLDMELFDESIFLCHLSITYHMSKNHGTLLDPIMENAETAIMLPMKVEIAEDLLLNGSDSKYVEKRMVGGGVICEALRCISEAQGYHYEGFCSAELVLLSDYKNRLEE